MAAIDALDGAGIDPGIGDGTMEGLGAEIGGIGVRVLSEPGHADSEDMNISHCLPPLVGIGSR